MNHRRPSHQRKGEPTIALINIVFLMLIFFMVAGQLAPPLDGRVDLLETAELDGIAPPRALVILADGTLIYEGQELAGAAEAIQHFQDEVRDGGAAGTVRLVPDRALPARELMALSAELTAAGADRIVLVTERGLR
ncbi:MAG: biopolymer transporter ExbD [Pseudomonadota bacterium]